MKFRLLVVSALAGILLLHACKSSRYGNDVAKVDLTNFESEIEVTQNLIFTFNKDVMPVDSLQNKWLEEDFVQMEPKVKGKFKWNNARELVFSPASQFPPATEFKATITDKAVKYAAGKEKLGGNTVYQFHTPYLELQKVVAYWAQSDAESDKPVLQADIEFNMEVDPRSVVKLLTSKVNSKEKSFKVISTRPSSTITVAISELPVVNDDIQLRVELKKVPEIMDEDRFVFKTTLAHWSEFDITDVKTEHDGLRGKVLLTCSQPVKNVPITEYVRIEPEVPFEAYIDGRGFTVASDSFSPQQTYRVIISDKLPGYFGGEMKKPFKTTVSFGKLMPQISFQNENAFFLGAKGSRNMAITLVNVDKVKLTVVKVFENNIMHLMQRGESYDYHYEQDTSDYDYGGTYYDFQYYETEDLGEVVYEKDILVSKLRDHGFAKLLKFDFEDKLQDKSGIYVVKVQDADRYYITDSRIISISDLGLIVKEDKDRVYCFVNSIASATPVKGANVSFISKSNQLMGQAKTDGDGLAVFEKTKQSYAFRPAMVSASLELDYNFLLFNAHRVDPARFEVGGKRMKDMQYDAFLYGERGIYRPGETIHLAGIVRTPERQLVGNIPVKLKVITPSGRELQSFRLMLDDQSAFDAACPLPAQTMTGTYTAQLFTGNDILLASKSISVEEFMPDRIKVDLTLGQSQYRQGETVKVTANAVNYFGPPAANRSYEMEMTIRKGNFAPKGFDDYIFGQKLQPEFMSVVRNGMTDINGKVSDSLKIPAAFAHYGKLDGRVLMTVFDESGRPVNRAVTFDIFTQQVFLGIKYGDDYTGTDAPVKIPLVALNQAGKPVKQQANITVVKSTWYTALQNIDGQFRYVSQQKNEVVESKSVIINGQQSMYSFIPRASGEYEVRVALPGSTNYVSRRIYAYRYGDTYSTSFEVNTEGTIDIEFNQEMYQKGDKAKVLLKLPFEGKVLVSVERDQVIEHFYVNSDKKVASFTLKTDDRHIPNAYISATLIKPHQASGLPLTVAHGFASFSVEDKDKQLTVKIDAAEKSFSKTQQVVKVKTKPNTWFTLAAVDEGILALNDFKTPDPYGFFFQKRALEVENFDIYPYLFPEIIAKGGDMSAEMGKRVNPLTNKRVKLVSYWSGVQRTDMLGNASVTLDIPQFSGKLRLMVVACNGPRFGSAEKSMTVADPVVITSGLPRFTSPGDQLEVPVTIANTTNATINGTVSTKTTGVYTVVDAAAQNLSIKANSEVQAMFRINSKALAGDGKVIFTVNANGKTYTEETDITNRPVAPLTKSSGTGKLEAGKKLTLNLGGNFLAGTTSRRLVIGNSPIIQYTRSLDLLVNYPHGCIEQTISTAFPQLYYGDLGKMLQKGQQQAGNASQNVQAAIQKIQGMQLSNGAVSYWQGSQSDSWWGTAYAAHFLIEAQKAGFDVHKDALRRSLTYLRDRLKTRETEWFYYNNGQKKEIAKKEVLYSLYVLALAGKPEISTMNYYKSNPALLSTDTRTLLACSYALAGDKKRYKDLMPKDLLAEVADNNFSSSFYSALRDQALMLNTLLEVDPASAQTNYLSKHVGEALKKNPYLNTQEAAFGFLAMGKIARQNVNNTATATVFCDGKKVGTFSGGALILGGKSLPSGNIQIVAQGKGSIYYFWETEGVPADGKYKIEDSFLEVRKKYYSRGRQLLGNKIPQNELVVVEITLRSTLGEVPNVAITDMLPAGFEIENSRLRDIPDLNWVKDAAEYDFLDIRDDRINIFVTATPKPKKFYYLARAVSTGTFQTGPVAADAMYKGEYHSYFGGGPVTIFRKKTAGDI